MMDLTTALIFIFFGFAFGWMTANLIYGRKDCGECFIALIRGQGCNTCNLKHQQKELAEEFVASLPDDIREKLIAKIQASPTDFFKELEKGD